MKYIDVSEWQGEIDWETAKSHIDGAILRAGWGQGNPDRQFARNAAECNRLGIPCGAYWFSYAHTSDMARREARCLLEAVGPYRMELPLAFDFEYDSVNAAAKCGVTVTRDLATAMVFAFCETVERGGYWCLNYANPDFLGRYFSEDVPQRFGLWLAQWPGGAPDLTKPPRPDARLWQWSSRGSVPGISGDVDLDEAYTDFAGVIRSRGMNNTPQDPAGRDDPAAPSPLAPALAWAIEAGILPPGADGADVPTLAAVAEMFCRCRERNCHKEETL